MANELFNYKAELEEKNNEIKNLHELIDKIQDDKSKLTKKISKLLENERELVLELDSIKSNAKRSQSNLSRSNSSKSLTSKLDSHIKNIENERDFFKQEVNTLQKLLKTAQHDLQLKLGVSNSRTSKSPSSSLNHKSRRQESISTPSRKSKSPVKRAKSTSPGLSTRCSVCSKNMSASPTRSVAFNSHSSSTTTEEVKQLKRERDELQTLLDKFERHMAEIQSNVKVLTSERDKYNQMYEETKCELQRVRKELINSKGSVAAAQSNVSLAAQAILKRVETERDTALFDLRNAISERETFKDRLKMTSENAIKEKQI